MVLITSCGLRGAGLRGGGRPAVVVFTVAKLRLSARPCNTYKW